MFRKKQINSIAEQVRHSAFSIAIILVLPVILSLTMMLIYSARYQSTMSNLQQVASIKPVVDEEIADKLFFVAAGRASYESSGVDELIGEVNKTLEQMLTQVQGEGNLRLTLAHRTMNTLEGYARQVQYGMESGMPVAEVERIVDEVRNVGALVDDMLDEFISAEIAEAHRTTQRLTMMVMLSALLEVALMLFAYRRTVSETTRLNGMINEGIQRLESIQRQLTGGNLKARVPPVKVEELQELADHTNYMADRLETLIELNRKEQENLAKSELRLLQAQINPHFLYNTLDTIIWQAESGKQDEVIYLTRSLSDFFRISLSSGADWITVSQEVQHVSAYLSIQKIRYRDILNYKLDVQDALADGYMIKLLIQPLVENALYHGIKARRGGGVIRVSAKQAGSRMYFSVSDTGKGMTKQRLEEVRSALKRDFSSISVQESSGFGLRNVDMRIRLYYHQESGLTIESDEQGTCVSFDVPYLERKDVES